MFKPGDKVRDGVCTIIETVVAVGEYKGQPFIMTDLGDGSFYNYHGVMVGRLRAEPEFPRDGARWRRKEPTGVSVFDHGTIGGGDGDGHHLVYYGNGAHGWFNDVSIRETLEEDK